MKRFSEQSGIPQAKNSRFFIDDILSMPTQSGTGHSKYVQQLSSSVKHIAKFKTNGYKSTYMIRDLPANPEQMLAAIFESAIQNSKDESRKQGINPTHIGCIISSEQLNPEIRIPFRPITENTVEAIFNRFLTVGQSKKQDETSLWGAPFTVEVTTIDRKGLRQRKVAGSGRRTQAAVHHRVEDRNLIKVDFGCLGKNSEKWNLDKKCG